ncbi:DUF4835 family protein [Solitalea lacus]|uniref:type IX secretion system protein PorD n=1 Tax=Solitalea lacus TaxID=2911172 RepID=UPI001EDB0D71|nr:DUF4835 family protein [Solitalea lacus]UKJ08491.1 DUF4835 family protein [Solitalea lacus]
MLKRIIIPLFGALLLSFSSFAQDLNCRVSVVFAKVSTQDTRVFQTLETQITNFMNGKKWANDNIQPQERIEASIIITVNNWDGSSQFDASAQIQSSRPVYGTSYNTPVLNIQDRDWKFTYSELETLEYSENSSNNSNLAMLLAFYANIIVGMDYDTFSLEGGTPNFTKAQNVVNQAQNSPFVGWKAFENNTNRYWLAENLLNGMFKPVRDANYVYHRKGLDAFNSNIDKGRGDLLNSLLLFERPYRDKPTAFIFSVFFTAKNEEIAHILQKADITQKTKILAVLKNVDPSNYSKYEQGSKN